MIDRTTKALLLAIALGLWANVVSDWVRPTPAAAQELSRSAIESAMSSALSNVESTLSSIASDVSGIESDVDDIEDGTCSNGKLC